MIMKNKYGFLLLLVVIIVNSNKLFSSDNDSYYWYKGKKIILEYLDTKKFIIFDFGPDDSTAVLKSLSDKHINVKDISSDFASGSLRKKWAVVDKETYDNFKRGNLNIVYEGPYYRSQRNILTGLSHIFYVKLLKEGDFDILENLAKENHIKIIEKNKFMPLWYTMSCTKESKGNSLEMANIFYASKLFAASEPELMLENMISCSNDTYYDNQWGLTNTGQYDGDAGVDIDICRAHGITTGSSSTIVAIIDDGVELNHPDLNIYSISYDTETGNSLNVVYDRHGTSVAGISGALKNNSIGITGVAPICPIMSISSRLVEDTTTTKKLADGINFAWQNGASVINCSWFALEHQMLDDAIEAALTQGRNGLGCIVVCAAGNFDNSVVDYPASANDDILVVGAISPCGERKNPNSCDGENWGSNYGQQLGIMAPGVLIPTTDRQGNNGFNPNENLHTENGGNKIQNDFQNMDYTACLNGTSAAAPHVAGVAALLLSLNSSLKGKYVSMILEKTAQKVGGYDYKLIAGYPNGTWDSQMGYGLLDAYEALLEEYSYLTTNLINRTIDISLSIPGNNIYIEDVNVTNYSDLTINYSRGFIINSNFNVEFGSTFNSY